jgi:microcystin-dependent protein
LTIGRSQSNTEDVYYTNVAGNTVTISLRGLSQTALTLTTVAGNRKVHNANESLEMTTHHGYDLDKARLSEDNTYTGKNYFSIGIHDANGNKSLSTPATAAAVNNLEIKNSIAGSPVVLVPEGTDVDISCEIQGKGTGVVIIPDKSTTKTSGAPTADAQIANKKYVDDRFANVVNASETVNGTIQLSTVAQQATATSAGTTGARLVPANSNLITTPVTYAPAYLTGDTGAQGGFGFWGAVADGSFRLTLEGVARNIDGISFLGVTSMADVAAKIQLAIRAVTAGLETCSWSTDHFIIRSGNTTSSSSITVLSTSTGTVGTDISGAGASDWMDADVGNGVVTITALSPAADVGKIPLIDSLGRIDNYTTLTGEIRMFGGATAPTNWLFCDGTSYLRSDYPLLFLVLGTTYGSADGTHFNVPDMRGRVPIGAGTGAGGGASGSGLPTGGTALTAVARGGWRGAQDVDVTTLYAKIGAVTNDTNKIGAIAHAATLAGVTGVNSGVGNFGAQAGMNMNTTAIAGTTSNFQPVMCVNFIIKA